MAITTTCKRCREPIIAEDEDDLVAQVQAHARGHGGARGTHVSAVFQDLAVLALLDELEGVLSRAGHGHDEAGRGARVIYYACLGILMTASNGALDVDAAVNQLREVIGFVVPPPGEGP